MSHDIFLIAVGLSLGVALFLGWFFLGSPRRADARRARADLVHRTDELQEQVAARTADLRLDHRLSCRRVIRGELDDPLPTQARSRYSFST
jgi:hypothetical protein